LECIRKDKRYCGVVEKVRSSLFNKIFGDHKTFGPSSDSFIDNRGKEMGRDFHLPIIPREKLATDLEPMINAAWPTRIQIDRDAVDRVFALGFLESGHNVILAAAQGLGKTMLAKNVAPPRPCSRATASAA
jgi:hypothetical protein